jgi:GNAT superfamily N-acetyltransferase
MEDQASYTILALKGSELTDQYKPMVFSKWLRSLRYGNDYFKLINQGAYFELYHRYIERLLTHKDCIVRLAVLSDDTDIVLGFSVCRDAVLDYVHVHRDYRRNGIGSALLPKVVSAITHVTKNGISFWTAKCPQAQFNPFQ